MRCMGGARRRNKERKACRESTSFAIQSNNGFVRHVGSQVIVFISLQFHLGRAVVEHGSILVHVSTNEAIELLKTKWLASDRKVQWE